MTIRGGGGASLQVELGHVSDDGLIRAITGDVAAALFPSPVRWEASIDENDGGWNFGAVAIEAFYRPASRVTLRVETTPLAPALAAWGYHSIRLFLCLPHVDSRLVASVRGVASGSCRRWDLGGEVAAPAIVVTMEPDAVRGWVVFGATVASLASVAICWILWAGARRLARAWLILVTGALGILAPIAAGAVSGGSIDHLAVSGAITGGIESVARVVDGLGVAVALLGGVGGFVAGLHAVTDARNTRARSALPPPP